MPEDSSQKYLVRDPQGNVYGPADVASLRQWVQQGRIIAGMHIAARENEEWVEVSTHPALADLFGAPGAGQPLAPSPTQAGSQMPQGPAAAGPAPATYPVTPVTDAAGGPISYAPVGAQSTNVPGMLAFISGTLSIFMLCPAWCGCPIGGLFAVAAIILGVIGLRQIKANPERYTGRGLAVAGLALGIVMMLLYIVAIIVFIFRIAHHP